MILGRHEICFPPSSFIKSRRQRPRQTWWYKQLIIPSSVLIRAIKLEKGKYQKLKCNSSINLIALKVSKWNKQILWLKPPNLSYIDNNQNNILILVAVGMTPLWRFKRCFMSCMSVQKYEAFLHWPKGGSKLERSLIRK